jgi:hypothetical protein
MNSSALSDMNEKRMYYLHKWKVQMRSFLLRKTLKNLKVLPAVKIIKLRKSEE